MKCHCFATVGSLFLAALPLQARTFTDVKGRQIEAELVSSSGDVVTISVGGREVPAKIEQFSEPDQRYIQEWIAENPDRQKFSLGWFVDLKEGKSKQSQKVDYDEKLERRPRIYSISISNRSPGAMEGVKVVCDAIVKDSVDTRNNAFRRLNSPSFQPEERIQRIRSTTKDASIPANGRLDIDLPFFADYYVDRDGGRVDAAVKDIVLGAWIRIYKGEALIGEYRKEEVEDMKRIKWDDGEVESGEADVRLRK